MTELYAKPGNVNCAEVRELLSDLIDVRRGELPHPDGTRLAEPGLRAAVELHLASCAACGEELAALEEIGAAYADFGVGEVPAQHFEAYGQKVRARLARNAPLKRVIRSGAHWVSPRRRVWRLAAFSGLAAALALVVLLKSAWFRQPTTSPQIAGTQPAPTGRSPASSALAKASLATPLRVKIPTGGVQMAAQDFIHVPSTPDPTLNQFRSDEGRFGYLVFGEKYRPGEAPLLGVELRTTRDVDRVKDEGSAGLKVYSVRRDSPAAKMGLRQGDLIVKLNDLSVADGSSDDAVNFFTAVKQLGTGAPVSVSVVRPENSEFIEMKPFEGTLGE